jgi:hypothetical protein
MPVTGFDKDLRVLDRQDLEIHAFSAWRVRELDDIARHEKPLLGLGERRTENRSNVADRLTGKSFGNLRRDQLLLDFLGRELVECDVAKGRNDVEIDLLFVEGVRTRLATRLDAVLEPARQELAQALLAGAYGKSEIAKLPRALELREHFFARLAVEIPPLRVEDQLAPPAILSAAPLDVALVISPPRHACCFA